MNKLQELFEGSAAIAEDNLAFLEDLFARFQEDPESVDLSLVPSKACPSTTGLTKIRRTLLHVPQLSMPWP